MNKEQKTDVLLQMMEQPEQYTEQQWLDILSDEECRELYTMIAMTQGAVDAATPLHDKRGARRVGWVSFRKIAAIFLAAAFLGGLAWAISGPLLPPYYPPAGDEPTSLTGNESAPPAGGLRGAFRFSDIRLDSILTVVSEHYGKTVCYRNEEPRAMKLITTWNPADSLSAFIEHLNRFDYLHLTLQGDTIFVKYVEEEIAR